MDGTGRGDAPFSGRVWQEIDRTIASIRAANCTARRFLEIDGPYGLGLTSIAGDENWLPPSNSGALSGEWDVRQAVAPAERKEPWGIGSGTYLLSGPARPVPVIASEFHIGIRAIEAYEAGCQPLELSHATRAARDLALEEERLIYYGTGANDVALLNIAAARPGERVITDQRRQIRQRILAMDDFINLLQTSIISLAERGFAGPFALALEPDHYAAIYSPNTNEDTLRVDLLRSLFRGGIYLAPVIRWAANEPRIGVIVSVGRAYSRLVVGQDWVTTYRGRDGLFYRFLLMSSLQLRISEPRSVEVLVRSTNRVINLPLRQQYLLAAAAGGRQTGQSRRRNTQTAAEQAAAEQVRQAEQAAAEQVRQAEQAAAEQAAADQARQTEPGPVDQTDQPI